MNRRDSNSGMTVLILVGACALAPSPTGLAQCEVVKEKLYVIKVDENAIATPDCVEVKGGKTTLVWAGGANVKQLIIAFKDPSLCGPIVGPAPDLPDDPTCAGDQCTLEKAKQKSKKGTFCYSVVVIQDNGKAKTVDPKLIINPHSAAN